MSKHIAEVMTTRGACIVYASVAGVEVVVDDRSGTPFRFTVEVDRATVLETAIGQAAFAADTMREEAKRNR